MGFRIQDIKSALQYGGARPSLFDITMQLPASLEIDGNFAPNTSKDAFARQISFLCTAASLPASTISEIDVPYKGRKIKVAGSRTFEAWSITVLNDEDFVIRKSFEAWMNAINHHSLNIRGSGVSSSPESYKTDAIVKQYAKDNDQAAIRKIRFTGLFPTAVSAIELNWATENEIENFTVTLAYDLWEPDNSAD